MNRVILMGRLTRDPEVRYTTSGKSVASFSLAVDRRMARRDANEGQPTADFINVVAWEKSADFVAKYFHKGNRMLVEGRLQTRNYDAKDGTKRYVTEVISDNIEFCESKNASSGGYNNDVPFPDDNDYSGGNAGNAGANSGNEFGGEMDEEEIPF